MISLFVCVLHCSWFPYCIRLMCIIMEWTVQHIKCVHHSFLSKLSEIYYILIQILVVKSMWTLYSYYYSYYSFLFCSHTKSYFFFFLFFLFYFFVLFLLLFFRFYNLLLPYTLIWPYSKRETWIGSK